MERAEKNKYFCILLHLMFYFVRCIIMPDQFVDLCTMEDSTDTL